MFSHFARDSTLKSTIDRVVIPRRSAVEVVASRGGHLHVVVQSVYSLSCDVSVDPPSRRAIDFITIRTSQLYSLYIRAPAKNSGTSGFQTVFSS
jgi:hypothetical protein